MDGITSCYVVQHPLGVAELLDGEVEEEEGSSMHLGEQNIKLSGYCVWYEGKQLCFSLRLRMLLQ